MKQKKIFIIALVLAIIAIISACGDDKPSGLKYNVTALGEEGNPLLIGVTSTQTDYKRNDVTLDFYYGSEEAFPTYFIGTDSSVADLAVVGMGIYLCNAKYFDTFLKESSGVLYKDYKEIPGLYFMNYVSIFNFTKDDYRVNMSDSANPKYNHKETLHVPVSIISPTDTYQGSSYFCLVILHLIVDMKSGYDYFYDRVGCLSVEYQFIDDETVRLSQPEVTLFADL